MCRHNILIIIQDEWMNCICWPFGRIACIRRKKSETWGVVMDVETGKFICKFSITYVWKFRGILMTFCSTWACLKFIYISTRHSHSLTCLPLFDFFFCVLCQFHQSPTMTGRLDSRDIEISFEMKGKRFICSVCDIFQLAIGEMDWKLRDRKTRDW